MACFGRLAARWQDPPCIRAAHASKSGKTTPNLFSEELSRAWHEQRQEAEWEAEQKRKQEQEEEDRLDQTLEACRNGGGQASEQNEAAEAEAAESFEAEAAQGSERNEAAEIVEGEDAIYGSLFGKQV